MRKCETDGCTNIATPKGATCLEHQTDDPVRLSVTLTRAQAAEVDAAATRDARSRDGWIRRAITAQLAKDRKRTDG